MGGDWTSTPYPEAGEPRIPPNAPLAPLGLPARDDHLFPYEQYSPAGGNSPNSPGSIPFLSAPVAQPPSGGPAQAGPVSSFHGGLTSPYRGGPGTAGGFCQGAGGGSLLLGEGGPLQGGGFQGDSPGRVIDTYVGEGKFVEERVVDEHYVVGVKPFKTVEKVIEVPQVVVKEVTKVGRMFIVCRELVVSVGETGRSLGRSQTFRGARRKSRRSWSAS